MPPDPPLTSLARAYSLSEVLPPDDSRVEEALERALALDETEDIQVTATGLRSGESDVPDVDGSVSELSRDLRIAGVDRISLPGPLSRVAAVAFLESLRGAVEGRGEFPAPREALASLTGLSFDFAPDPAPEDSDALSLGGLFPEDMGSSPVGSPEEEEVVLPDLAGLVGRYLAADPEERDSLETELREAADEARTKGALDAVAEAVERLASEGDDPAEGPHLSLAVDLLQPGVADRVATRLGAIRDEQRREQMIRVAAALGEEMARALAGALADESSDRGARRAYVEAMIALGDDGRREAADMLESDRWWLVRNGAAIFGGVGTEEDVQHLTSALAHDEAKVRRETVMALARIGGEDAGMLLLGMIEDTDPDVRASVATALGALGVEKAVKPLLRAIDKEDQQKAKVAMLRALGALGDPGAVSVIEKHATTGFFSRPAVPVRIAAYRALSSIGTPHAMTLLEDAREDRDEDVRTAVRALLEMREEPASPA